MNRPLSRNRFLVVASAILAASILFSCALPALPTPQPQSQPTPTPSQPALPPALVEVSPLDGSLLGADDPITFYFSQPMDRAAVEAALFGLPPGSLTWSDDSTLTFTPNPSLAAGAEITVAILTSAKDARGVALPEPVTLTFYTSPLLRAVNFLPVPDSQDAPPTAAVAVTFNQPVVALGAEDSLPEAFLLDPLVEGRGEWLSTSTYIFHPEPALAGGETYTVRLNTDLVSTTGAPLDEGGDSLAWSFETALPRLVSVEPSNTQPLGLDPKIELTFNQPMDAASVEGGFSFQGASGPVAGAFAWDEKQTVMTFTPSALLERGASYSLAVTTQAASLGGTPLPLEHQFEYTTYGDFDVTGSDPLEGGVKGEGSVRILFSAPVQEAGDPQDWVSLSPEVPGLDVTVSGATLQISGYYTPETDYTLALSPALADRWGQALDREFALEFRTAAAKPSLGVPYWGNAFFVRPDEAALQANAVNLQSVDVSVAAITLDDFRSLSGSSGYENMQTFTPQNPLAYSQTYDLPPSRSQAIALPLAAEEETLAPGVYYVSVDSPQLHQAMGAAGNDFAVSARPAGQGRNVYLVVASNVNLTFKNGATDALVWATDLRDNTPVADAPLAVYDEQGTLLASGQTDNKGLWQGDIPPQRYSPTLLAVLGQPGEENFGLALSSWNTGILSWEFDIPYRQLPPQPQTYLYTDRPIYRPGQTVYFRGLVRQAFDGRYELPEFSSITLELADWEGRALQTFDLPLSPYGAFHGEYQLSSQAEPGWYTLGNSEIGAHLSFDVAEYRKPEIELEVAFDAEQARAGDQVQAESEARYYFGAPAGDVDVQWSLYERPAYFDLPGYQTGLVDAGWLSPYWADDGNAGRLLQSGQTRTEPDGGLLLALPLRGTLDGIPASESPRTLTLELTAQDESGFPVSARAETFLHPADFYIGLRPDQWVGQGGTALGFDVFTVNWERQASPSQELQAEFSQVEWQRTDPPPELPYASPTFEPVYTPAGSSAFSTGLDGKARLSFTPSQPGTYMLDVSGGGARTQVLVWVGGGGQAAWPDLANDLLRLSPDQDSYQPGQTAKVFIPNPFGERVPALVTVERGKVLQAETITLGASGSTWSLPLTEAEAPNVYVAATLLGPGDEFRQGYATVAVEPSAQALNVELTAEPQVSEPRGELTLDLRVTDQAGNPAQGEFSLSVVDKAALALADPNSADILSAFYGQQALGVNTGLSLAAHSGRFVYLPPGMGGGGGSGPVTVREQFPDTAYWNPTFITDSDGRGQAKLTLPDSLTTWFVEARGLTVDTRVGQAETEVVTTRSLLIRPATPRFLVAGDHVELAAVVHNNTERGVRATVSLAGSGFTLDQPGQAAQTVDIPANDRVRVSWWGTAGGAGEADLTFSATSSDAALQDAAKAALGALPIRAYVAPQAFVTGGMLADAGARQESVSLPRTFSPTGGGLEVEMSPSLASALLTGLEALPPPSCACNSEEVLSYLLPNLETYHALQASGIDDPDLEARLDQYLAEGLDALVSNQNSDGGWGWLAGSRSDPYISAYVLFGLGRVRLAGLQVPDETFTDAHAYLQGSLPDQAVLPSLQPWELDRLAFTAFSLQQSSGLPDAALLGRLYEQRDRLGPWAQALLALGLVSASPTDPRASDLLANLEATAVRTASSANWESEAASWRNPGAPLYTTAVVVYALAQHRSAAPVLTEAARYLVANSRRTELISSYESAWVILALTEAMKGFGELQADFAFTATLNGAPLANGDVSGTEILAPVTASVPLEFLSPDAPNALTISRESGLGRLYYRAALLVERPVETLQPLNRGMDLSRAWYDAACLDDCPPLSTLQLDSTSHLTARLTLTLPHDAYYLVLEDYIPAGSEILDQGLKTSQQAQPAADVQVVYDPDDPFGRGWGWWYFNPPQIRDDRIQWSADYLPAGTYELTYTLIPTHAGEFRVLPARAWLAFFPDVQGTSAGTIFTITP
ncbi:MAG: Ig-like domain-containing protein [Chloroflexota bacterium]